MPPPTSKASLKSANFSRYLSEVCGTFTIGYDHAIRLVGNSNPLLVTSIHGESMWIRYKVHVLQMLISCDLCHLIVSFAVTSFSVTEHYYPFQEMILFVSFHKFKCNGSCHLCTTVGQHCLKRDSLPLDVLSSVRTSFIETTGVSNLQALKVLFTRAPLLSLTSGCQPQVHC